MSVYLFYCVHFVIFSYTTSGFIKKNIKCFTLLKLLYSFNDKFKKYISKYNINALKNIV